MSDKKETRNHVSFSELKIWNECSWKHKLVYLEKIKGFEGNEYTAFGTAIHSTCEQLVEHNISNAEDYFQEQFLKELKTLIIDPYLNNLGESEFNDTVKKNLLDKALRTPDQITLREASILSLIKRGITIGNPEYHNDFVKDGVKEGSDYVKEYELIRDHFKIVI